MKVQRWILIFGALILASCATSEKRLEQALERQKSPFLDNRQSFTRIQFGSCSDQRKPQPIWTAMLKMKPELYLAMGDNVYTTRAISHAEAYFKQIQAPEFAQYRSQVPILATWDDHDFGENDSGKDNPLKTQAREQFLKFWVNDDKLILPQGQGIYHGALLGEPGQSLQVLLLDLRTFRDALESDRNEQRYTPTKDRSKQMLGESQWKWLEKQLNEPADFRIIVSSIQFLSSHGGGEKWANFPHEKSRLIKLIKKARIRKLVILSGDRHHAEINSFRAGRLEILEVTSSGINRGKETRSIEKNEHRLGKVFFDHNFGQLNFDWRERKLTAGIYDTDGKLQLTHTLDFSRTTKP